MLLPVHPSDVHVFKDCDHNIHLQVQNYWAAPWDDVSSFHNSVGEPDPQSAAPELAGLGGVWRISSRGQGAARTIAVT